MMEAVRTSEPLVNFNETTRRYIPDDSKFHTRRRENLKSHNEEALLIFIAVVEMCSHIIRSKYKSYKLWILNSSLYKPFMYCTGFFLVVCLLPY
jgi:hypothetical protein